MALFGLGKKSGGKGDKGGDGGDAGGNAGGEDDRFKRKLRSARTFFEHAETTADTKNYDYSIEMYIGGLRHDPDNLTRHEELHEVAKRRKVSGGKPTKPKKIGPYTVDKMLQAEMAWALDPLNVKHMVKAMGYAVDADQEPGEEANLAEIAYWIGSLTIEYNANPNTKPDRAVYLKLIDLFERIQRFDKAVEACKRALHIKDDDSLRTRLRDLEAELYNQTSQESEGSKGMIKDAEEQQRIQAQLDTTGSHADQLIAAMREQYEEDPEDTDRMQKLVDALLRPQDNEKDKEAAALMLKAYEQTNQYRYKLKAGDIKIRQFNRILRSLADKVKAGDEAAKPKYQEGLKRRLVFELQEFNERVQHYPTDLKLKFELGKRQFMASQFDDAIGSFQQSKAEPKSRGYSHLYLGKCYVQKGWLDEAVDTLSQGIEQHPADDDTLGKELRYDKMVIHLDIASGEGGDNAAKLEHAKQAQALASHLLQTDINYRDIRDRMNAIKETTAKLNG
ncbi:MAG: tetratricopeptide repeat protein [Phycisphaerales bacterium JB063]